MDTLNRDAQIAAEAYDGAVYHLGLADQAARQARKRANAAQAQYDAAQKIVSRFAVAAYRSGADFGSADVYLGVDGPGGAVTRADTLAAVGAQVTRALLVAQSTKIVPPCCASRPTRPSLPSARPSRRWRPPSAARTRQWRTSRASSPRSSRS